MRLDDLDYNLPPELIARTPAQQRDAAKLLVYDRATRAVSHRAVSDLPTLLNAGDLLVFNDTRVLPARFEAIRIQTGGRVEGLFLETRDDVHWLVMLGSGGRLQAGEHLALSDDDEIELIQKQPDGSWSARKLSERDTQTLLDRVGVMPLPPYIRKARGQSDRAFDTLDRERYQTVYAKSAGAVAAPTAGLHFTESLLQQLADAGIQQAHLTLHVGLGTFAPVRVDRLEDHDMHTERFTVPAATLAALKQARQEGRRIIPVGTTSVRALESLPDVIDDSADYTASTKLMIQPGFEFRWTDALMTNFHLPCSTLLALVSALTGLDELKRCYDIAVANQYRFFSYGDAMLIV
ncbi:tRNA preQ1(34) S-adenosylmethionine ribosyltransferase-isomerase QueA [Planctomycetales bacterium ZRK34]|nr:tRNA preQ1(34) S-adenosylmethionine ribosyltransferase-isomerase QueA [Planctomycetales bacterium ZRK34]